MPETNRIYPPYLLQGIYELMRQIDLCDLNGALRKDAVFDWNYWRIAEEKAFPSFCVELTSMSMRKNPQNTLSTLSTLLHNDEPFLTNCASSCLFLSL